MGFVGTEHTSFFPPLGSSNKGAAPSASWGVWMVIITGFAEGIGASKAGGRPPARATVFDHHAGLLQQGVTRNSSSQRRAKAWLFSGASLANENMHHKRQEWGEGVVRKSRIAAPNPPNSHVSSHSLQITQPDSRKRRDPWCMEFPLT